MLGCFSSKAILTREDHKQKMALFIEAIQQNRRPEFGAFHPLNTFRSPFAPSRKKAAWYLKSMVKMDLLSVTKDEASFSFSLKNAPRFHVLVSSHLCTAEKQLPQLTELKIDFVPSEGDTIPIQQLNTSSIKFDEVLVNWTENALPCFYAMDANSPFSISKLGSGALLHTLKFENECPKDIEMWALVAALDDVHALALRNIHETSPLPPLVSSSVIVPHYLRYEMSAEEQTTSITLPFGCVAYAFAWTADTDTANISISFSLRIKDEHRTLKIIDKVPEVLFPAFAGNRYWSMSANTDIWPPPGIPGMAEINVTVDNAKPSRTGYVTVACFRVAVFNPETGGDPKWVD